MAHSPQAEKATQLIAGTSNRSLMSCHEAAAPRCYDPATAYDARARHTTRRVRDPRAARRRRTLLRSRSENTGELWRALHSLREDVVLIGSRLGSYEVLAKLGEGGMGEVYRARDTRLDRDVALKTLLPDRGLDADARRRFAQEARAASSLNHPNIVTVFDVGSDRGIEFIAMELVPGQSLDQR